MLLQLMATEMLSSKCNFHVFFCCFSVLFLKIRVDDLVRAVTYVKTFFNQAQTICFVVVYLFIHLNLTVEAFEVRVPIEEIAGFMLVHSAFG